MEETKEATEITKSAQPSTGDLVRVNVKVKEGGKERLQAFEGTVIAVRGKDSSRTFTVRKIAAGGIGAERIWPVDSPSIESIKILKKRPQKRAKLYYMRKLTGKEATGAKL
ncbi:50S ribosomal protein L19 [Patescibacteria group bacterium]|nr:50S ribosomal protein L19 [Patescibacteria group bacterium]